MSSRCICATVAVMLALSVAGAPSYARGSSGGGGGHAAGSSGGGHATGSHAGASPRHGVAASIRTPPYLNTATSRIGTAAPHR